jgi:Cof subfamily protein (haloacid dehalogenase superfamily)
MHASAEPFAAELGIEAPIISYNGAMIREVGAADAIFHLTIPPDLAAQAVERAVAERATVEYFCDDTFYVTHVDHWARWYWQRTDCAPVPVGDLRRLAGRSPTKILLVGEAAENAERLPRLQREYDGRLYVTLSLPEYIELLHPEVSKANALRWLARHLGVTMQQTMALGDQLNDLEMIEAAGIGVVMAGAQQDLRARADFVPTSQQDGVAEALETLVLSAAG